MTVLLDVDRESLESRGYRAQDLAAETVVSLEAGTHSFGMMEAHTPHPGIGWVARSASGKAMGLAYRAREEKVYRWFAVPSSTHLPMLYGSQDDYAKFFETGKAVLTEGIFDRIAIKRHIDDYAVFARLSKGIARSSICYLSRYGKQIMLAFDNDGAGISADEKALRLLHDIEWGIIKFPSKDPSQRLKTVGDVKFKEELFAQLDNWNALA